jgi:hypothetical protein
MTDTPTRRAVLGAGAFVAGSLFAIDPGAAEGPLPPTPACHDGDEATLPQIEGRTSSRLRPNGLNCLKKAWRGSRSN